MTPETDAAPPPQRGPIGRAKSALAYLKANRKRLFWLWIGYQAVKGTITLSLIWIPLLLIWLRSRGEA